jgi:hypothetical protein
MNALPKLADFGTYEPIGERPIFINHTMTATEMVVAPAKERWLIEISHSQAANFDARSNLANVVTSIRSGTALSPDTVRAAEAALSRMANNTGDWAGELSSQIGILKD